MYSLSLDNKPLVMPSLLGFELRTQANLTGPFRVRALETTTFDDVWEPVLGQERRIRNHYKALTVYLTELEAPHRKLDLEFRIFNDGLGFRYLVPEQDDLDSLFITKELTQFNFAEDGRAWWIRGKYEFDAPEQLELKTLLSEIDSANTPMTYIAEHGTHVCVHEADLTNFAGMTLMKNEASGLGFRANLVPWPDGDKVKTAAPMTSPWRVLIVGRSAADLLESRLILNLNRPNQLADVSWIKPMKYVGIWWGMHIKKYTWVQGKQHGATTENTKAYIDFAAEHGIDGVLAEGWNRGWERWGETDALNVLEAYDDFNLPELAAYAASKGISLIGHHETTANVVSYEGQMDSAFALYAGLGIHAVKTGYVGRIRPEGQFHYGQWMVEHYRRVVQLAARHRICLDVHEPVKGTGIERTWPNMVTREGGRGMEYNAWSDGNPPDHTTILPFTRLMAGPMDYTPGIFDLQMNRYNPERSVHTTLAKQLALMVVLYSPLQMAADLIENYEDQPAFKFITDLELDWDESKVLSAGVGEHVTMARRVGSVWYLGAITNEKPRIITIKADLLFERPMVAECYADFEDAHWAENPYPMLIRSYEVMPGDDIRFQLAPGGGCAIRFRPPDPDDEQLPGVSELMRDQHITN